MQYNDIFLVLHGNPPEILPKKVQHDPQIRIQFFTALMDFLDLLVEFTLKCHLFHRKIIKNPFFEEDIVIHTPQIRFFWNLYMTNITTYLNLLSIPHYLEFF